jgi:4-hydroxy-tetrahydrodipicolinate synthase
MSTHTHPALARAPRGVLSALPTPFDAHGEVDHAALAALTRWQRAEGVAGVVAYGTTGEAPTLSERERAEVTETCLAAADDLPVVVGVGTNCTRESVARARAAQAMGAHGGLLVTPYYNKPTQEGLELHFRAVAEAVPSWPLILYVVPGRTSVSLDPTRVARLVAELPNIVAVKDATGDLRYGEDLIMALEASEGRATALSGDDPTLLAQWAIGGAGAISVLSDLCPGEVCAAHAAMERGDLAGARALLRPLAPLARDLFVESNPAPVKAALSWRFAEGGLGAPGVHLDERDRRALAHLTPHARLPLSPLSPPAEARLRATWGAYLAARGARAAGEA